MKAFDEIGKLGEWRKNECVQKCLCARASQLD